MFHNKPTHAGQSVSSSTTKPSTYFPLPNYQGAALYALFTQHANLNFFEPGQYRVHLKIKEDSYAEATLSENILARENNNKKFDIVLAQVIASGMEGAIHLISATFRLDTDAKSAEVKFASYVAKHSTYNLNKKTIHEAKLKREQEFTRIGAPDLKMKEPVLVDKLASDDTGSGFLVMKQLIGEDLRTVIKNQYATTKSTFPKLSTYDLLNIILQLGDRIQELHEGKDPLIHRDLKPANIFIKNDLHVQPIDFGFTKRRNENDSGLVGSPIYLDPFVLNLILTHQLDGYPTWPEEKKRNLLTEKSEMFIFGIIIAELLNILPPTKDDDEETNPLQTSYNRNCNIVLDAEKVELPGFKKVEIVELVGILNHLFNMEPEKRPDITIFMLLLRGHLEPILDRLANEKDFTRRTQLKDVPEVEDDIQIKLKSLSGLLLFKPATVALNGTPASSYTSSNDSFIPELDTSSTKLEDLTQAKTPASRVGFK